ncbi:MAG: hypothetical protein LBM63_00155 [Rikenellaceae bacterium]|nr:hypothetical protein [Rikenellaceae bacterium]
MTQKSGVFISRRVPTHSQPIAHKKEVAHHSQIVVERKPAVQKPLYIA